MQLAHTVAEVRVAVKEARTLGKSVGFVPTMGALHEGHLSLIRAARQENDFVVISIFVNPTQFAPTEDLEKYPRTLAEDIGKSSKENVDIVFAPSAEEMYPPGYSTYIIQENLTERLCGASRPGHFHGVCTVVAKLFNIVTSHRAYFGQKDYQQSVVIRRMVKDLNMDVDIRVMPTVREADGLAMSSRNKYLGDAGAVRRREALCLIEALRHAEKRVNEGEISSIALVEEMKNIINDKAPQARIDYISIVDPDTLDDVEIIERRVVAAIALRLGDVRLIDNIIIEPPGALRPDNGLS